MEYEYHIQKIITSFILGLLIYIILLMTSCKKECNPTLNLYNESAQSITVYIDKVYAMEVESFSTSVFDVIEGERKIMIIQKGNVVFNETLFLDCGINYLTFGY